VTNCFVGSYIGDSAGSDPVAGNRGYVKFTNEALSLSGSDPVRNGGRNWP